MFSTSVVICTFDRVDGLIHLLETVNLQTPLPEKVIVVDQSKTDKYKAPLSEFQKRPTTRIRVEHHPVQFQGLTKARNYGLDLVTTPVTTFIDDDVLLEPGYFEAVRDFFEKQKGVMLSGLFHIPGSTLRAGPPPSKFWAFYRKFFCLTRRASQWRVLPNFEVTYCYDIKEPTQSDFISGSNFSLPTPLAQKVRFDEKLVWHSIGEDIDFPIRVRKEHPNGVWMDPTLPVEHPETPKVLRSEFLVLLYTCHHYYLFHKMWDRRPPFSAYAQFVWSRIGNVLMQSLQTRKAKIFPSLELLMRSARVELKVLRHFSDVCQGKFPILY